MLPSLEIFKNIPCPDSPHCKRPQCIFAHGQQPTSSTSTTTSSVIPNKRSRPNPSHQQPKQQKQHQQCNNPSKALNVKKSTTSSRPIARSISAPFGKDPSERVAHVATFTGPPTIKADISSHTALKIRQTISDKLYEHYRRIYPASIHGNDVAAQRTQDQEQAILTSTSNTAGYKQQAMTILMQLKKKEPEAAKAVTSKTMANDGDDGGMDATFLNTLVLTESQLDAMQYPPRTLLDRPTPASTKDQQRTCDRCKKPFTVKAILDAKDVKACQYHFGRLRVSQSFGEKLRTYTCCDDTLGSLGCEKGPHVFKEEQVDKLHASLPFVKVPPSLSSSRPETILALDCEMGYTTLGMELIRLTVINANHEKILDELVLPSHMVIDLNTRYSGITTLAGVKHNLVSIRQALFDLMDPTTILLGHGLENDLKALRIVHDKVIDTAALFPHPHGLPYRYGLRMLATKYLSKFIQTGSDGHDSFEDAGTCLELLHEYVRKHKPSSSQ